MAIRKEDLYKMVESLNNEDMKTAFDFMQFLIERSKNKKPKSWQEIDQLESEEGNISGEGVKREFGLQVDLP